MSCKFCDCVPCMCGKHAYPDTPEGERYDKETEEFNTHDPDIARYISDCHAKDH